MAEKAKILEALLPVDASHDGEAPYRPRDVLAHTVFASVVACGGAGVALEATAHPENLPGDIEKEAEILQTGGVALAILAALIQAYLTKGAVEAGPYVARMVRAQRLVTKVSDEDLELHYTDICRRLEEAIAAAGGVTDELLLTEIVGTSDVPLEGTVS